MKNFQVVLALLICAIAVLLPSREVYAWNCSCGCPKCKAARDGTGQHCNSTQACTGRLGGDEDEDELHKADVLKDKQGRDNKK